MVLLCFIFNNSLPVRILVGSYNEIWKLVLSFQVGVSTMRTWGLTSVFLFWSQYTAHMQVKPVMTGKDAGSYVVYAQ